ncbi:acryloyl-CoA reductase [Oceanomicrobium pacificus]|uniref:Acryloyl-CoA reductase n=1 Tax=Oceanomicrobium pacificus TaxID=2692916 RepID=A0A6B0TZ83_9RHOB|nr:acryloyl-CoA reductase [Oceanomicrobium pacificus]MXU66582.1 acryloyl-CoA reductase [Oceanomicrobium pacificus]
MGFNALVVEKSEEGATSAAVRQLEVADLPKGEVLVAVDYSTVNYKDGLCIGPGGGLVRSYPHVPGIDFAGTVERSEDPRYTPGDKVVLTGWRVGEAHWGGYAQKASVRADWLVPLPDGLTTRQAMAVGTAGFTAMLAVMALEDHGLEPGRGPVLVTGAAGGVGSVATAILAHRGYEVAAVTGRPETEAYLRDLGATTIVPRAELNETTKRPLESETWAGCVDAVGGAMLARVLGQMKYGCSVAAVGLAGGAALPATVIPFLLRGVNLLGIDSVMQPYANRERAWARVAQDLPMDKLEAMVRPATLHDLPQIGADILRGQVQGRVVVDVNAEG